MNPEMTLFEDFITIQDHRFLVIIDRQGYIEWDDREGRLKQRPPSDRELELRALSGDERARQRLANEQTEYGIRFKLDPVTFEKFKEWDAIREAGFSTGPQEAETDSLLEQFFWREINPYLMKPLTPEGRAEEGGQGTEDGGRRTEDGGNGSRPATGSEPVM